MRRCPIHQPHHSHSSSKAVGIWQSMKCYVGLPHILMCKSIGHQVSDQGHSCGIRVTLHCLKTIKLTQSKATFIKYVGSLKRSHSPFTHINTDRVFQVWQKGPFLSLWMIFGSDLVQGLSSATGHISCRPNSVNISETH